MGDGAQGVGMAQNVRDNFGVLAAVAEINALGENHPLMRQIMLRLSQAYRDLEAQDQITAPGSDGATVVRLVPRAPRWRWARCPTSAA
jgi:hypothetical protein